jgi:hypothetical protein
MRLLLILLFFSNFLQAQELDLYGDQVRVGFEIEFDRSGFLQMVDDFDMGLFQFNVTSTDEQLEVLFRDYVTSREVLDILPVELQEELTRGLKVSSRTALIELPTNPEDVKLTGLVPTHFQETILSEADALKMMKDKWM